MNYKIASVVNYLAAIIGLIMGLTYLFKPSFMPYHLDAVELQWQDINIGMQSLILALMRAVSGGYLAVGVVIIILQNKFANHKAKWIPLLILLTGIITSITSMYAIITIRLNTPGQPPIILTFISVLLLTIGYIYNIKSAKE